MDRPFKIKRSKVKKPLKCFEVSQDIFQKILNTMDQYIVDVEALNELRYGYKPTRTIKKYNDTICLQAYLLNHLAGFEIVQNIPFGKYQVCVTLSNRLALNTARESVSGGFAKKIIDNIILRKYTQAEYDNILKSHDVPYDKILSQQHYLEQKPHEILHFTNCSYYDINNAHGSGLIELFPKCKDVFMDMYEHRKDNDGRNKQIFNNYWGMLARLGTNKGTYNWIVQRTTKTLSSLIDKVRGEIKYVNTDGVILANCKSPIESSDRIGEFKRKDGELYVYKGDNYWVLQFYCIDGTVETKGNIPLILRDRIDLKNNKVIEYDIQSDKNNRTRHYVNVKEIHYDSL